MQMFECPDRAKGFGVRSSDRIYRGTFLAQYIGEILTDNEADRRSEYYSGVFNMKVWSPQTQFLN